MFVHGQKQIELTEQQIKEQEELNKKKSEAMKKFNQINKETNITELSQEKLKKLYDYNLQIFDSINQSFTVCKYRQDILILLLQQVTDEGKICLDKQIETFNMSMKQIINLEIQVLNKQIKSDPKSYDLWSHRVWLIRQFLINYLTQTEVSQYVQELTKTDIQICAKFLQIDNRNFHVWCYWFQSLEFLVQIQTQSDQQAIIYKGELEYLKSLLLQDFTNYSALHYVVQILQIVIKLEQVEKVQEVITQIIVSQMQAIQLCSNEQSLWLFIQQVCCLQNIYEDKQIIDYSATLQIVQGLNVEAQETQILQKIIMLQLQLFIKQKEQTLTDDFLIQMLNQFKDSLNKNIPLENFYLTETLKTLQDQNNIQELTKFIKDL